jgi:hypothetical protein
MALKDEMPMTAEYVSEKRAEWGDAHVTAMVKAGMRGQRGCFYAVEQIDGDKYRTAGAPFDWNAPDAELFGRCVLLGLKFAGIMQPPKGFDHGQN